LCNIDSIRTTNLKHLDIGILYVPDGAKTINQIVSKKNIPPPSSLYHLWLTTFLEGAVKQNGTRRSKWHGHTLQWHVGSEISKDERRSKIGNCQVIFLFYDSSEPFDLSSLFLGQVTTFICTISPVSDLEKIEGTLNPWKAAFFMHYEEKCHPDSEPELQMLKQDQYVCDILINFPPEVPSNYAFGDHKLYDFCLTKSINGRLHASVYHQSLKLLLETPVGTAITNFIRTHFNEWFKK